MNNTHTATPSTPAPEACPTTGRTAKWCTDQSHLTCAAPARTAPTFAAAILAALTGPAARHRRGVVPVANDRVDVWDHDGHRVTVVARMGGAAHLTMDDGEGFTFGTAVLTGVPASVVAATAAAMLDGVEA